MYVNDFLGSAKVGMMSTEEVGMYLLLLFLDWQEGGFVYDHKRLAKWCRMSPSAFKRAWEQVGKCFIECDGRMFNQRLAKEREKQEAWSKKAAKGAATTNEKRRNSARPSEEIAPQKSENSDRIPFPSPTPVTASTSASADVTRLLNGLTDPEARLSWQAEINVARQGMHGPILTDEQIDRACRDYVGNGHLASPTLRHFRAFLKSAGQAPVIRTVVVKGGSGVATADDEAAWADAQKAIEQLSRGQLSADAYNALPANLRAGLRRAGGWTAIRDAKPGDLPWRRKDFLAGYHDSPATVTA